MRILNLNISTHYLCRVIVHHATREIICQVKVLQMIHSSYLYLRKVV